MSGGRLQAVPCPVAWTNRHVATQINRNTEERCGACWGFTGVPRLGDVSEKGTSQQRPEG